jgi:ribosomal protein S18 acetylase RimI-like enzyme
MVQSVIPSIDERARELHESRGFKIVRRWWQMWIEGDGTNLIEPPPGITIAPFQMSDAREVHAVIEEAFADHWDTTVDTFEVWSKRSFARGDFEPAFWFVAREGDEAVGCLCGLPSMEDKGWIRNVSVRPAWRGKGIAKSLLTRAFAAFAEHGRARVGLGVDSTNETGAPRLYESVGMRTEKTFDFYERPWRR